MQFINSTVLEYILPFNKASVKLHQYFSPKNVLH